MLVYVSGPYCGPSKQYDKCVVDANIDRAARIAARLWEIGHAVICPHTNSAYFEQMCMVTWSQYLDGYLKILARCDAIVMTPDWEISEGAGIERSYALKLGMPVYVAPDLPPLHPVEVHLFAE